MSSLSSLRRGSEKKRSSALIITLIVLLLVTLLVVSLSSMIGLERSTTHESFENQRARELSQMAVDEVVATLRDHIPMNAGGGLATNIADGTVGAAAWAAAPGKIEYLKSGVWTTVPLYSGQASGSTTTAPGQVDLNEPVLGSSSTSYPIISPNTEYGVTPMPVAWIEVLQDGTAIRSNGSGETPSANNPIVGRYAYWTDAETCKVNINTAGRGQTTYYFNPTNFFVNPGTGQASDLQNLSGAPSRVDLSQLDGGITANQSLATYHYTYGGYWLGDSQGDYLTTFIGSIGSAGPYPTVANVNSSGQLLGMQHFNSIQEWTEMTNDLIASTNSFLPISTSQVEQNKFYLTTRSWTPELTPWGFNKLWLQANNDIPNPSLGFSSSATTPAYGNKLNAKGVPMGYPPNTTYAKTNAPQSAGPARGPASVIGETRYFVTPYIQPQTVGLGPTNPPSDFQVMADYDGTAKSVTSGTSQVTQFINAMMVQLNRTDWPGFNGESFVAKYGQAECEDLAYNLLHLYDSAIPSINAGNASPSFYNLQGYSNVTSVPVAHVTPYSQPVDSGGIFGSKSVLTVDGRERLMGGVGEWPYIDQVTTAFSGTTNGNTFALTNSSPTYPTYPGTAPLTVFATDPYAGTNIFLYKTNGVPANNPLDTNIFAWTNFTKQYGAPDAGVGFAPAYGTNSSSAYGPNPVPAGSTNIVIYPSPFNTNLNTLVYTNTTSTPVLATNTVGYANIAIQPTFQVIYPIGFKDTYASWTGTDARGSIYPGAVDVAVYANGTYNGSNVTYGVSSANTATPVVDPGGANHPYFYGTLDSLNTAITNQNTGANALQAVVSTAGGGQEFPGVVSSAATNSAGIGTNTYVTYTFNTIYIGPFDRGSSVNDVQFRTRFYLNRNQNGVSTPILTVPLGYNAYNNEDWCFQNVMMPPPAGYTPGVPTNGAVTSTPWPTRTYAPTFLFDSGGAMTANANIGTTNYAYYDCLDPRVYRYLTDWKLEPATTTAPAAGVPSGYFTNVTDPVTGITEDYSKFAWPDVGANYFNSDVYYYSQSVSTSINDLRLNQSANNIEGFPDIGWLSVLPLNCESSRGATTAGGGGGSGAPGTSLSSGNTFPIPWRTLSLSPQPTSSPTGTAQIPDWILLEAFAIAYDQTFASQTQGKINVNQTINPQFPSGTTIAPRLKPLEALIQPASYANSIDNPSLSAAVTAGIAADMASGPTSANYIKPNGATTLPSDVLLYPSQVCQLSSLGASGTNQWQKESLARNLIGVLTTQSSDFKVNVVAQAVKQIQFTGNPTTDLVVTGEQRMSAIVSRTPNLGPDNIPDTSDEPPNSTFKMVVAGTPTSASVTNAIGVGTPPFKYVISDVNYINN
jgi:hypothetical protein